MARLIIEKYPLLSISPSDQDAVQAVAALPDVPQQHFISESISALRRFVRSLSSQSTVI